jgi:hypothetical protein
MVRTMLRALRVTPEPDQPPPGPVAPPSPAPAPWLAASVGIGGWFASPADASQLAGYASLAWRPRALGVALAGNFAGASTVETATFMGEIRDVVVAVEARDAFELVPRVHVAPAAGVAVHALQLSGAFKDLRAMESRRYDPAIRAGVTGLYALPRGIDVGLAVSADCLLRRQRYEGATEELLVVPRLQLLTELIVGIRL